MSPNAASVASHRSRAARRGLTRVEVTVRKEDAPLVRGLAAALSDPARRAEARDVLRERLGLGAAAGLKALLLAAPLEGVELTRDQGPGRAIDL